MLRKDNCMHKDMFSLSTCWNIRRHTSGRKMIEEIMTMGFRSVELNYNVTADMFREIEAMVCNGEIQISSIHNVFPHCENDDFGTDSLLLGYPEEEKRREAIRLTMQSVDYAARVGARAVVIHPGEIPLSKNYNELLEGLILDGKTGTLEYRALLDEMLLERKKKSPLYVGLIQQSVETICDYIAKKGYAVVLGLENRMMCHQIPVFDELPALLDGEKELPVYFWFDIGHGLLMEDMGLFHCAEEAYRVKDRIIGMHIHDAVNTHDHLCPFLHSNNLRPFLELIRHVPIKVLELQGSASAQDVIKGTDILISELIGAAGDNFQTI